MVNPTPEVDPNCDLSVEDMEKTIYACLAQADLALEAMNAKMTVEQLVAAKETEAEMKAELAASEIAKAKAGNVVAPAALAPAVPKQPADVPVVSAETVG